MNNLQADKCSEYLDICRDQLNNLEDSLEKRIIVRALQYIEACVDGERNENTSKQFRADHGI